MFPLGVDKTDYELVTAEYVKLVKINGENFLKVSPEGLLSAERAFKDISHLLRSDHLAAYQIEDPEATKNDRFVAMEMLKNAVISAEGKLPMCQDTGTALVMGYRGDHVIVDGDDGEALSRGIYNTYQNCNLRFSQLTAHSMFEETNTENNLPAQIDIIMTKNLNTNSLLFKKAVDRQTKFLQKTKAVLNLNHAGTRTSILELSIMSTLSPSRRHWWHVS